jgi:hypothetical protein
MPTSEIFVQRLIPDAAGAGVLWSNSPHEHRELSAYGVLAWEGRAGQPEEPHYEWIGVNLLCNAAPTPFVLNGERFSTVDSFHEALKFPERSPAAAIGGGRKPLMRRRGCHAGCHAHGPRRDLTHGSCALNPRRLSQNITDADRPSAARPRV